MTINKNLVRAIAKSGLDFEDVAVFSGILSTVLVKSIQGEATLDEQTMKRISDILGEPVDKIWPEEISNQYLKAGR